jgi:hypothetical protein
MRGEGARCFFPPFLSKPKGVGNLLEFKHLAGSLVVLCMIGGQLRPAREVVTPEGLKVVPETESRNDDQVVESQDGNLHVVFRIFRSGQRKTAVYYSRREPGQAWSAPFQISEDSDDCEAPVIAACADGSLLTAWIDRGVPETFAVVIRRSEDNGKTWASVARQPSGVTRVQPRIAVSDNTAYVCFASAPAGGTWQRIYFLRSGDSGKTWADKDLNFKEPRSYSSQPDLLVRGDNVWVTWCDQDVRGMRGVVLASSSDRGETWPREPIMVSDARAERPSLATFDDSDPGVAVVWRAAQPGATSFIYEDRCDGGTCGRDQVLLESKVIPVTYRIVKYGNNHVLLWLNETRGLSEQQKQIHWVNINPQPLNIKDQQVVVWPGAEHANVSQFDARVVDETLYLAAVARFAAGDWRALLLSRKADGQDRSWVIGGEAPKERSSLALVRSRRSIAWLFQERRRRILPMESRLNDSLVFGRLEHYQ